MSLRELIQTNNRQKAFDDSFMLLIAQGRSCVNKAGSCVYSNESGENCAVGVLMDAEELRLAKKRGANETGIFGLNEALMIVNSPDSRVLSDPRKYIISLLGCLQDVHDEASTAGPEYWHQRIAEGYLYAGTNAELDCTRVSAYLDHLNKVEA